MTEILTTVLILITAYYAWQTRRTVNIMQATNESNIRPVLSISIVNNRPEGVLFVDLVICNSGNGIARDVKFEIIGDELQVQNVGSSKHELKDISVIENGIKVLAPHETRKTWLLSMMGRIDEVLSSDVKILVSYKNADFTKTYKDEFALDFMSLTRMQLGHDPLHNIDKEIEKIRKVLEKKI